MNSFRTMGGMMARMAVGAALLALAGSARADVEKGAAKVVAVHGSAEMSLDGSSWAPLTRGESLREGAMVRTTAESVADLDLGRNGSLLRLLPASTIALTALTYERTGIETVVNTEIELRAGRIVGHVQKLSAASKYEVKTPKVVAGIRGTRYSMSADGNVVVGEGSVVVVAYRADGGTITRVVNASEAFNPVTGSVAPATEQALGDVGGSASSVPGIVALPGLQGNIFDDRTVIDRVILPVDIVISRTQPGGGGPAPNGNNGDNGD
jgi:hypothetical protein